VLERGVESTTVRPDPSIESNPQRLEVFNGIYMHAAEQMGAVLRQTASSVNIKERLDFSCAIFDARTGLVANAPHMPVHLGSMGASVAAVVERFGDDLRPGDAYLLNSPYAGGTHLPDLTVVTPVFDAAGSALIAFVASRAHHADIGGVTPGSMPPWSRSIDDEGVLIEPLRILRDGVLDEAGLRARFRDNPHPAATRTATSPISARSSQRMPAVCASSNAPRANSVRTCSSPTCRTSRTTRSGACAARSASCATANSATSSTTARSSRCESRSTRARAMQLSISRARRRSSTTT
jgi:hypothetical protein